MRPSQLLEQHRQAIQSLETCYKKKGITNFRVIGSVANGTDTESSDIDFLVDVEENVGLFAVGGLYSDLEDLLKIKIDLVLSNQIHPYFRERILKEAKYI